MVERMLVIGADAAGMTAAAQARRRRPADDLEIVAIERGRHVSYSACGIPYWIGGVVASSDALVVRTAAQFRDQYAIDVRIGQEAVGIDLAGREVTVRRLDGYPRGGPGEPGSPGGGRSSGGGSSGSGPPGGRSSGGGGPGGGSSGSEFRLGFDQLVVATGAVPVRPPLPGIDARGVYGLRTLDDGEAIRAALDRGARQAVVVGAGYIGLEMAEALVQRGVQVTVVEATEQPMSTLDPDMGR